MSYRCSESLVILAAIQQRSSVFMSEIAECPSHPLLPLAFFVLEKVVFVSYDEEREGEGSDPLAVVVSLPLFDLF